MVVQFLQDMFTPTNDDSSELSLDVSRDSITSQDADKAEFGQEIQAVPPGFAVIKKKLDRLSKKTGHDVQRKQLQKAEEKRVATEEGPPDSPKSHGRSRQATSHQEELQNDLDDLYKDFMSMRALIGSKKLVFAKKDNVGAESDRIKQLEAELKKEKEARKSLEEQLKKSRVENEKLAEACLKAESQSSKMSKEFGEIQSVVQTAVCLKRDKKVKEVKEELVKAQDEVANAHAEIEALKTKQGQIEYSRRMETALCLLWPLIVDCSHRTVGKLAPR
eukprot:gnl/MRDRNA2_/MRDRNA2_34278_c0_seq1.p1 gnl/MRDRNA2_/MRDRNA2_34278_c0~~gnl/MRDRNA2_/MRDRNA2_34278_c0_seq1.p1  ORF type:complete len:276 (-),score=80.50 gnl/MRDRNA2_/MRDRNA2_34278_c0_seq1:64-891(-)